MPELPEVEVARRYLEKWLRSATLTRVELSPRLYYGGSAPVFAKRLVGRRIARVERRGKWLRLVSDGKWVLYSHLGMTGKWVLRKHDDPPQRFERARLDTRLFGRLFGLAADVTPPPAFAALGPDALVDGIDAARLHARLARIKRSV